MPYYDEYFDNGHVNASLTPSSGPVQNSRVVLGDATLRGFRSRASKRAYWSTEVADITADPYAYFLDTSTQAKYSRLLKERGLPDNGPLDRGHSFSLIKHTATYDPVNLTSYVKYFGSPEYRESYVNFQLTPPSTTLDFGGGTYLNPSVLPDSALDTFAQQAYSRVAPTAVVFDAAQFFGELREGLPRLGLETIKSGLKFYRGLGSDYLNVEFGWKPFLDDLLKMGKALSGATSLLRQQGNPVHRSYGTPRTMRAQEKRWSSGNITTLRSGSTGWAKPLYGLPDSQIFSGYYPWGSSYFLRSMERSQWFEGMFSSFYNLDFDPTNYFSRLNEMVNLKLTPSVLWELAPWSWLVDWFLRIQDTIKANELAGSDKLVMHYGYAMEHTIIRDLVVVTPDPGQGTKPTSSEYRYMPGLKPSYSGVSETVWKRRLRANPYGFKPGGFSSLSSGQQLILGALGLTRLK